MWVTFVGSGALLRDATGHPRVDTVAQSVSSRARSVLAAVSRVLVLIGCLAMAWGGVRMVALQWAQTSPSIEIQNVTGRALSPRSVDDSRHSGVAAWSARPGIRRSSVLRAICPSTRARGAPRQKWMPKPKAMCRLS